MGFFSGFFFFLLLQSEAPGLTPLAEGWSGTAELEGAQWGGGGGGGWVFSLVGLLGRWEGWQGSGCPGSAMIHGLELFRVVKQSWNHLQELLHRSVPCPEVLQPGKYTFLSHIA